MRCDNAGVTCGAQDGTLYYATQSIGRNGSWDYEIFKARPENGQAERLSMVSGGRIPVNPALFQLFLSPDGKWLAGPLMDGPMGRFTDFGERSILIARSVAWSLDSQHIYAAVAEIDADVVLLEGLLP